MPNSHSFTIAHEGIVNVLKTNCQIMTAFDPTKPPDPLPISIEFIAIWDTGASATVISQQVVDRLGLTATGMTRVSTANGTMDVETYLINILLPNSVGFVGVQVSNCNLGGGADVLIGMDIIGSGDFVVTNFQNKTIMSYRHPSTKHLDFVAEHHSDLRNEQTKALIKNRPNTKRKKKK